MTCDPVGVPYTTNYEYPKFSVNDLNVSSFNLPQSTKMPLNEVHMIYTVECSFTDPTLRQLTWSMYIRPYGKAIAKSFHMIIVR